MERITIITGIDKAYHSRKLYYKNGLFCMFNKANVVKINNGDFNDISLFQNCTETTEVVILNHPKNLTIDILKKFISYDRLHINRQISFKPQLFIITDLIKETFKDSISDFIFFIKTRLSNPDKLCIYNARLEKYLDDCEGITPDIQLNQIIIADILSPNKLSIVNEINYKLKPLTDTIINNNYKPPKQDNFATRSPTTISYKTAELLQVQKSICLESLTNISEYNINCMLKHRSEISKTLCNVNMDDITYKQFKNMYDTANNTIKLILNLD